MTNAPQEVEAMLQGDVGSYADDLLGYIVYAFPWGSTPELSVVPWYVNGVPRPGMEEFCERYPHMRFGPDLWSCRLADKITKEVKERGFDYKRTVRAVQVAVTSGHGIGKSAMVGMLVSWILDTRPFSRGIVTANTGEQLRTRTFAEIVKWKKRAVTAHWWEISEGGMFIRHKTMDKEPWGVIGQTWRKENSEAFAGQHAVTATSFYVFDEASAIHDLIWQVSMGGLTDGEPMIFCFGNPTRASGRFFECFHRNKHRWVTMEVDSREAWITNKEQFAEWEHDFGEDSDFFRVRVRGVFPRLGDAQFIPHSWVAEARTRDAHQEIDDPTIMSVDVARQGSDESVIAIRRGRDARTLDWRIYREPDTMRLVGFIIERYRELTMLGFEPDVIFVDGVGVGGGVVDRLRELGYPVQEVNFGERATRSDRFYNKASECWGLLKEWLRTGSIPDDDEQLAAQLTGREFNHDLKQRIALEKKRDMKERGLESPDRADALAMTFAVPVARRLVSGIGQEDDPIQFQFNDGHYYAGVGPLASRRDRCVVSNDPFSRLGRD